MSRNVTVQIEFSSVLPRYLVVITAYHETDFGDDDQRHDDQCDIPPGVGPG